MTSQRTERPLDSYPRPNVAVDTAVLTVDGDELSVVLVDEQAGRRLPGTFLRPGERLADAVRRSLEEKAGVRGLPPEQLEVFDDPQRDSRGWVLSVAHLAVVPVSQVDSATAHLVPVRALDRMPFGHNTIVERAVERVREEYLRDADPRRLIGESFTLRDLQRLHEVIAGEALLRETFRKRMSKFVEPTGTLLRGVVGKPPQLFQRKAAN